MGNKRQFSTEEARSIGTQLDIDWSQIDLEQFRRGLTVELEHGAMATRIFTLLVDIASATVS